MQGWIRFSPLLVAAVVAGCSEFAGPTGSAEPVEVVPAARDNGRDIFMAVLDADVNRAEHWNRIIILDEGRTERQAEVRLYDDHGETWRYHVEKQNDSGWVITSREMLPATLVAMSITSESATPEVGWIGGSGTGLPVTLYFKEIAGSVWDKPPDFSGNNADYASWTGADPRTITIGDVQWQADFLLWHPCIPQGDGYYCEDYTAAQTDISFEGDDGQNIGAKRVWLNYQNTIVAQAAPFSVSIVSGPTNITSEGTYAWTASASGGWGSGYSYAWQMSTDGGATWSSACFGTGSTCTRDVAGGSPSFMLRVIATSSSGGNTKTATSATHAVTVNIPVNVSISGPWGILSKGTYTYTATASGVSNPSYEWYERFCTRFGDESSCTSWVTFSNMGNVFTRTLTPDCSGTEENNYQLGVRVVRQTDGAFGTRGITTALCRIPIE